MPDPASTLPSQTMKPQQSLGSDRKRSLEGRLTGPESAGGSDGGAGDEEEQAAAKKRRTLDPVANNVDEKERSKKQADDSNNRPKEKILPAWKTNAADPAETEKAKAAAIETKVKALIESLPSDAHGLWKWPLQWRSLDEDTTILEKIRSFTAKKVFELLGVQEDELTNFVIDHIKQRKPPQELVDELRAALDNDAEVLVMKTWRMLVFETEAKARGYIS
ncbi:putative RNA-binding protein 25 [Actinomortierella ambigua]|nr:putative RNA-binding protein 25 [Actinomortierella ambigua]